MTATLRGALRPDDRRRGIALMVCAITLFGFMDATVKYLARDYPVPQIVWARFTFHLMIFVAIFASRGGVVGLFRSARPGLQLLRSIFLLSATLMFFTALSYLPLAEAISIGFVSPLVVTALAIPLLKERVGFRRWAAILVGFAGVLIVIRPGTGVFHWAAVLPLGMAVCYAFYQILTRIASRTEDARTSQLWAPSIGVLVLSAVMPWFWTPPTVEGWLLMGFAGFCGGLGHYLLIKAYEVAPASVLSPFVYTQLIWMIAIGYVIFGDVPAAATLVGGALVIGSGLYIFRREAARARSLGR
jgi:drug/metabolite transporter (DMT)-like permease